MLGKLVSWKEPVRRLASSSSLLSSLLVVRGLVHSAAPARKLRKAVNGGNGRALTHAIRSAKRSDTIFILGGGASVNQYTPQAWEHIKEHNSLGITNWILHSCVPDILLFETSRIEEHNQLFLRNLQSRLHAYRDVILCWKDASRALEGDSASVLSSCSDKLFVPWIVELPINYEFVLENYPKTLGVLRRLAATLGGDWLFQKRATLSLAIDIAVQAGFRNIVLCGVDLTSTQYFWEDDASSCDLAAGVVLPPTAQEGRAVHSTLDPEVNRLTIDRVIYDINRYYVERYGARLFVGASSSALHPTIAVYPWEEHLKRSNLSLR